MLVAVPVVMGVIMTVVVTMAVVMPVVMIMMMIVVMIMAVVVVIMVMVVIIVVGVVVMMGVRQRILVALDRLQQVLCGDFLLGGLGLLQDMVDDLVLEDGRPQLHQGRRVLLVILVDEALLAGVAPRLLDQGALELVLADLQLLLVADLADHEAEPHAPLGDSAVVGAQLLFRLAGVGDGLGA
jgi:hypothetical protein